MSYLVLPIICVIYFELLGQIILLYTKHKPFVFNAIIGFVSFLSIYYVLTFLPVYWHVNFKIVLFIFLALVLLSIILIVKNYRLLSFTFSKKQLVYLVLLVVFIVIASSYDYIGDVKEYDALSYSNLIGNNIYQSGINLVDFENGSPNQMNGYAYQSFYLLASCLLYLTNAIMSILGLRFFFFTQYIWLYSIIFYCLFVGFFINITNKIESKKTILLFGLLYFCFFGTWYWHLYQPYIGNSFRFLLLSYSLYFAKLYSDKNDEKYLLILLLMLLGGVACSNSNSVIMILYVFVILCVFRHTRKSLIMLIVFSIFPLVNIFAQVANSLMIYVFIIMVIISFVIIKYTGLFLRIINNKRIIKIAIFVIFILLTVLSYLKVSKIFDLNTFLNNIVLADDMRWSLTDFSTHWAIVINICLISLMVLAIKCHIKENWIKMLLVILFLFFTPFTVGLFNELDYVWFRGFEIVFNAYLIFVGIDIFINYMENKKYRLVVFILSICILIYVCSFQFFDSTYIRKSKKPNDYNFWLKMTNDEADALEFAKHYIISNDLKTSLVSSAVYQLRCEIPTIKTLFNRKRRNNSNNKVEYELVRMLYPDEEYFGACYNTDEFDYTKLADLAKEANLKLMILGKNKIYHDKDNDTYYPLYLFINRTKTPVYENNSFVIYDYR